MILNEEVLGGLLNRVIAGEITRVLRLVQEFNEFIRTLVQPS